ncbi:MAG: hypothetical protein KDA57_14435 [Planctomycetales bacterium]|nr:hypothetical protein [Planctomycetales bacterium]
MAKLLLAAAACLLVISPAYSGVVFEIETIEQHQGRQQVATTQVSVEGRLVSMQIPPASPGEKEGQVIYRGDRREMIIVDHSRQSYFVMDLQTMQNLAGQVNQALGQSSSQIEEAMKNVPESQRALVAEMMKKKFPGQQPSQQRSQPIVRRLSQQAKVYGYPCVLFEVVRDGRRIRNLWVTDWDNIEGGRRELAPAFDELGSFFQEMLNSMPSMGQADEFTDNAFAQIKELGGFPVATREYTDSGDLETESALRSAKRQQLDPADFAPPAGYRRQQMFAGGQALSQPRR